MDHNLAWKMIRQRLAAGLFPSILAAGHDTGAGLRSLPRFAVRLLLGLVLLEIANQEFQLFNLGVELFRRAAEPGAP